MLVGAMLMNYATDPNTSPQIDFKEHAMILSTAAYAIALAANATAATPQPPARDPDKMICRRDAKTGSLLQTTRTCKTRKEWEEISANSRRDVERLRANSSPRGSVPDFSSF
jgi:hypothetical protein